MRLLALEAHFLRYQMVVETYTRVLGNPLLWKHGDPTEQVTGPRQHLHWVDALAQAQGVEFLCPKCFAARGGCVGCHLVICWFCGVPDEIVPGPGRWLPLGTSLADLTLGSCPGKSNSVALTGEGCQWHGYVQNGDAT